MTKTFDAANSNQTSFNQFLETPVYLSVPSMSVVLTGFYYFGLRVFHVPSTLTNAAAFGVTCAVMLKALGTITNLAIDRLKQIPVIQRLVAKMPDDSKELKNAIIFATAMISATWIQIKSGLISVVITRNGALLGTFQTVMFIAIPLSAIAAACFAVGGVCKFGANLLGAKKPSTPEVLKQKDLSKEETQLLNNADDEFEFNRILDQMPAIASNSPLLIEISVALRDKPYFYFTEKVDQILEKASDASTLARFRVKRDEELGEPKSLLARIMHKVEKNSHVPQSLESILKVFGKYKVYGNDIQGAIATELVQAYEFNRINQTYSLDGWPEGDKGLLTILHPAGWETMAQKTSLLELLGTSNFPIPVKSISTSSDDAISAEWLAKADAKIITYGGEKFIQFMYLEDGKQFRHLEKAYLDGFNSQESH